jgi:hypothetical protein
MEHSVQNTSDRPHPSSARCDSPFGTCLILLPASKPSCVPALVGLAYDDVNRTQSLLNDPSRVWQLEQCRLTRPGYALVDLRASIAGRGKKGKSISRPQRKSAHRHLLSRWHRRGTRSTRRSRGSEVVAGLGASLSRLPISGDTQVFYQLGVRITYSNGHHHGSQGVCVYERRNSM